MSTYLNTGKARNTTLTISKGSMSYNYNIMNSFADPKNKTLYPALNDPDANTALARLSENDYKNRLQAFIRYVYSQNPGLQEDCPNLELGATFMTSACPVGETNVIPNDNL